MLCYFFLRYKQQGGAGGGGKFVQRDEAFENKTQLDAEVEQWLRSPDGIRREVDFEVRDALDTVEMVGGCERVQSDTCIKHSGGSVQNLMHVVGLKDFVVAAKIITDAMEKGKRVSVNAQLAKFAKRGIDRDKIAAKGGDASITILNGMGPVKIEKLTAANVHTLDDLADLDDSVAAVIGRTSLSDKQWGALKATSELQNVNGNWEAWRTTELSDIGMNDDEEREAAKEEAKAQKKRAKAAAKKAARNEGNDDDEDSETDEGVTPGGAEEGAPQGSKVAPATPRGTDPSAEPRPILAGALFYFNAFSEEYRWEVPCSCGYKARPINEVLELSGDKWDSYF